MTEALYTRQLDIFDPRDYPSAEVSIIGLGGIGSFTAMGVGKLGIPKLTVVDFDSVEEHNIPNQLYSTADIGKTKADATKQFVESMTGVEVHAINGKFEDTACDEWSTPRGVVVTGLDSMESRENVWKTCGAKYNPYVGLYIDARLGGQDIVVYAFNPANSTDVAEYEKTLHPESEVVSLSCTGRGIIDVGLQVSSLITRMVRKHYTNPEQVKNVTFFDQSGLMVHQGGWD